MAGSLASPRQCWPSGRPPDGAGLRPVAARDDDEMLWEVAAPRCRAGDSRPAGNEASLLMRCHVGGYDQVAPVCQRGGRPELDFCCFSSRSLHPPSGILCTFGHPARHRKPCDRAVSASLDKTLQRHRNARRPVVTHTSQSRTVVHLAQSCQPLHIDASLPADTVTARRRRCSRWYESDLYKIIECS